MNHFINLVVVIGMVLSLGPPLITLQRDDDDDDDAKRQHSNMKNSLQDSSIVIWGIDYKTVA